MKQNKKTEELQHDRSPPIDLGESQYSYPLLGENSGVERHLIKSSEDNTVNHWAVKTMSIISVVGFGTLALSKPVFGIEPDETVRAITLICIGALANALVDPLTKKKK